MRGHCSFLSCYISTLFSMVQNDVTTWLGESRFGAGAHRHQTTRVIISTRPILSHASGTKQHCVPARPERKLFRLDPAARIAPAQLNTQLGLLRQLAKT